MIEEIYNMKNEFLGKMRQEVEERGIERVDVAEMYKLADIVKDLAEAEKSCWEAEYYRSAVESAGYDGMGYDGQGNTGGNRSGRYGSMGYRQSGRGSANQYGRSGYSMGYQEHVDGLRTAMQNASPEERSRMREEARRLLEM